MSDLHIDTTVYEGRPADETGRLPKEIHTYDLLDRLSIPFVRVDHEAAMTIEACQGVDALLGMEICKNLFLCNRQKTLFYLLLMPGSKPFRTKELSAQIGSARLSFASEEYMEQFLDLTPGSVTVLGLTYDPDCQVTLLIDQDLYQQSAFGCHPCINTSTVQFSTADFREKLLPALGHPVTLVQL